jgi:hypothetical protein
LSLYFLPTKALLQKDNRLRISIPIGMVAAQHCQAPSRKQLLISTQANWREYGNKFLGPIIF